ILVRRIHRSSLFPYTTLFRSRMVTKDTTATPVRASTTATASMAKAKSTMIGKNPASMKPSRATRVSAVAIEKYLAPFIVHLLLRSEEHTSELQSRFDLVCRLL